MQTTRTIAPLFTWRSAIAESDLPATTRHVLLTLSTYMNERGGSAYPGSARLAKDSGLHQSTVKDHLKSAADLGWIRILRKGGSPKEGQRMATEYAAAVPGVVGTRWSDPSDRGSSPRGPGVQDAPITPVITPKNSRGASQNDKPPDPACIRCHGSGLLYGSEATRRCSCTFVADPGAVVAGLTP